MPMMLPPSVDPSAPKVLPDLRRPRRLPEYLAWRSMKCRCYNPNGASYKDYGGRGIQVCEEWRNSFANFLAYVGPRPTKGHSLDRYPNNDGNYEPGNVRWATHKEQANNRRPSGPRGPRMRGVHQTIRALYESAIAGGNHHAQ